MSSWEELYRIDINEFKHVDRYIIRKLRNKKKFLKLVEKYSKNKKIIEAGCGTGIMAGYFAKKGFDVTAIDISPGILKLVEEVANASRLIDSPKLKQMDIFVLNFGKKTFDVSFSNGVLEHFSDEQIILTLRKQMEIADYVVFGVPSTYFSEDEKMYGDERSLTAFQWRKLIREAGGILIHETGFHYDNFFVRMLDFKRYFRPKAFHLFVIKNR